MVDPITTIPKGWKMATLGEIISSGRISNYNNKRHPLSSEERSKRKGKYPYYGAASAIDSIDDFKFDGFYLLIAEDGTVFDGKSPMLQLVNGKFWVSNHSHVLQGKDIESTKFLFYILKNVSIAPYITGAVQPKLTKENLYNISFSLPESESEQHAIAAVLSSLDNKIEFLRKQNKTLKATAQAIFKEWFVNFNFPGATEKMIDSELGEIPEGWKVGTVNNFIKRETISYRCDQDDLSVKGKTPIIDQGTNGLYGYTEREPDFQASKDNPVILFTNHTCNMWFVNYPFCAIQNVIPFRGNDEYNIFFVYYMTLGRVSFIEYKGHWPDFEQKEYIIPTPKIANEFAEFVKPLQYKIWNNNSQIQTLSKLRDALLPKLMKGEVRVEGFQN